MKHTLRVDFETRSRAKFGVEAKEDDVGTWNYSLDPSTGVLCGAFSVDGADPECHDLRDGHVPAVWAQAVAEGWDIYAWNTAFEYCIVTNVLKHWPQPSEEQWQDAQAAALAMSLPASLEDCAAALLLDVQKDTAGAALINFLCKPISGGKHKGEFRDPNEHPDRFSALMEYCSQDVRTMNEIMRVVRPLSADERDHWLRTWRMNVRGIYVDTELVGNLLEMAFLSRHKIGLQLRDVTEGGLTESDMSNHRKVIQFLKEKGYEGESIAKAVVKEALDMDLPELVRQVLEARQALGKSSVAKLHKIRAQTGPDNRLRFCFRMHGTQTGRDSGSGVQPQNFPRGEKMNVDALIDAAACRDGEAFFAAAHDKKGKFNPLGGVVTCLRGTLSAPPGKTFLQCDWSAVEPRIGAWLVDDQDMQEAFRSIDEEGGADIYQIEAARFYGCSPKEVIGDRRQFGKVFVLQNQYESSERSIQRAAKDQYGLVLDLPTCIQCKDVWRVSHPKWVDMWRALNRGAIVATHNPGRVYRVGRVAFCHDGTHLRLKLPCERLLTFPFARVVRRQTPWGTEQDGLLFYGIVKHQWVACDAHGGFLFNAVIQGTGASLLRYAAKNLDIAGFPVVLRLHDEFIAEGTPDQFDDFKRIILQVPPWAEGLRLNGAGWIGPRFKKD